MRIARLPVLLLGAATAWLVCAAPVAADCQPAGPIEEALPAAPVAFVGVVTALDGPVATLAVREVWAGEVPDEVQVRGLADDVGGVDAGFGAGFSEDDRQWMAGGTYLVVPWVDGKVLRDSICTATTEWRSDLEALRPASARIVEGDPTNAVPVPPAVLAAAAVLLVIGVVSVLAFRRGERPR
jgi:hypothetical protein